MAIYIPGWYEQMSKAGTMDKLGNVLGEKFAPDYRANARLQEMVQQNPMLMEQFSNMDDATRAQLTKSLGFKNQDPIAKLPVGAARKEREEVAAYTKTMTPEQKDVRLANKAGTVSQKDLLRRDTADAQQNQKFEWEKALAPVELKMKTLDAGSKEILANEQTRALGVIEAARKKYPEVNMGKVVSDIMKNRIDGDTQGMLTVISADEGLSNALKTIIDIQQTNLKYANEFGLRKTGMQDDVARLAISATNQAASEYSRAANVVNKIISDAALAKISIEEALKADPERKRMYNEAIIVRDESKQRLEMYKPTVKSAFERMGMAFPEIAAPAPAGVQGNPTAGMTDIQKLAYYKQQAGIK